MNSYLDRVRLVSRSGRFVLALALVMGLVLTFGSAQVAQAATLQVGNDGVECSGEYPTIQEAVDNASAGDFIEVCPGTYTEAVTVNKSLTIESTDGAGATTVVGGFQFTADDIALDGFTIQGGATFEGQLSGVFLDDGKDGHQILNNIVTGTFNGIGIHAAVNVVDDLEIHDNIISNWITGIYLNPGSGHNISNNTLSGHTAAIGTDGISDTDITDNVFNDNGEAVGAANAGTDIVINDNDIENSNASGVVNYGILPPGTQTHQINAECNWWGDPSGPSGTDVIGDVDADPWQTAPDGPCGGTQGGTESDPQTAEQCKDGGWMNFYKNGQQRFKNQGDCIQYVKTGK